MPSEKAVVLNSGGLNSAVLTSLAAKDHTVALLHVRLGDRADEREAALFEKQAEHFQVRERLCLEMPHFARIGGNGRVNRKRQIEDVMALSEGENNCYVPGLIGTLLQAAFSWAMTIGAKKVLVGVSQCLGPPGPRTSVIYPDYSPEYIQLCNHLYGVASPRGLLSVEAPVMEMTRGEIIRLGHRLSTPFDLTWSCLSSGAEPCGGCVGCATRSRGFLDAGIPDPAILQPAAAR